MWTLEISGIERSLTDLGVVEESSALFSRNGAASVLQLVKPGPMDATLLAAYDAPVILRRDRVKVSGAWSGGSVRFVGYAALPTRTGSGTDEAIAYEFRDWWWKAERTIYHQVWHQVTGIGPGGVKTYTDVPVANVFLGVALDGTRWTSGEQMIDAITWLNTRTACVQLGTIEADVVIFSVEGRSLSVAEVLRTMLAHSPDAQFVTDYTTSPPTVHVRKNTSLTAVTLTAGTDPITQLSLSPKHDLQVPVVVIHFKTTNTIDGNAYPAWTKQVYPPNPGGYTDLQWETQVGALVTTLELEGSSTSFARASIITKAVDANAATTAARVEWWSEFEKTLASPYIDPDYTFLDPPYEVTDENGDPVSLTEYPYRLVDGNIAPWMTVGYKRATIKAKTSYTLYTTDVAAYKAAHDDNLPAANQKAREVKNREIYAAITLCNFNTAGLAYEFKTRASWVDGEPEPAGLAQAYYNSLATLRYEGQIIDVHQELPAENLLAHKLTLAGTALTVANQLIQEVAENIGTGLRSISIGFPPVLSIDGLMDLHRAFRSRRVWNNPRLKVTGDPSDNSLEFGANTPRRDTTSGNGGQTIATAHYNDGANYLNHVMLSANGGRDDMPVIHIRRMTTEGVHVATQGNVVIDSGALDAGQEAKFQPFIKNGITHYVLATASLDSGGGCFRFKLKSVQADYLTCRTWDGTTEGSTDIYIAKPPKLRHVASESLVGTTWTYTYSAETGYEDGKRSASDGTNTEKQVVIPVYVIGDEIFASTPDNGTDVTVSATELTYLDLNVDGRAWARKFEQ
jgi:hypothetical protein